MPEKERNFRSLLTLLSEAEVNEKGLSELDKRMKRLECTSILGENHPAVKQYKKCVRGAGDTVRSIIISANSRLAFLENEKVLKMLSKDDMKIEQIGIGKNGDGKTKTALFCVVPDNDKSYNFIVGMLYTQVFQELYYQADFNCGGRLPIHVSLILDEFANVALPDDFCSLLSTMRSREISSVIIIQNLAQIKALFKDTWETISGNCDALVYLGGNEASTHKYISELLGKATIDKKSRGESKGKNGSSSYNYDVLGRELMTPDEVRKLDNKKCLIFIRGIDPIIDSKFNTFKHLMFVNSADGKGKMYVHERKQNTIKKTFEILNVKSFEYYKQCEEKGGNVYVNKVTYEEVMMMSEIQQEIKKEKEQQNLEKNNFELEYIPDKEIIKEIERQDKLQEGQKERTSKKDSDKKNQNNIGERQCNKSDRKNEEELRKSQESKEKILELVSSGKYTLEQISEVKKALQLGIHEKQILKQLQVNISAEKMRKMWQPKIS